LAANSSSRRSNRSNTFAAFARRVVADVARLSPISRFVVSDESMVPTYRPGERVAVNRLAYVRHGPRIGDAVVLRDPEMPARYLLKRVAVAMREANGGRWYEVVGDNYADSRDSRVFGRVKRSDIVGKVWFKY
jgi:signal peptidase I